MDNVQEGQIQEESLTPIPRKEGQAITMDFPNAMRQVIAGKKVKRMSWSDDDYGFLKDEWLSIRTKGAFHTWLVSAGDLEGNDWITLPETNN